MARNFIILEPSPEKGGSVQYFVKWMKDVNVSIENTDVLWKSLDDDIIKAINYEFSDANPNRWNQLSQKYFVEKTAKGFPETIGVRTGSLKRAATTDAIKDYKKGIMEWAVNQNIQSGAFGSLKDKRVGDYDHYFNEVRPIFIYSIDFIEVEGKKAVEDYVTSITKEY